MVKLVTKKVRIQEDIIKKAEKALDEGRFRGIRSLSGLIEKALGELLESS